MSEIETLRKQLAEAQAKLDAMPKPIVKMKITDKGQLSISGLKPGWPITMPPAVWELLDAQRDDIRAFLNSKKNGQTEG